MTKTHDAIIIGTGQAGPFLAQRLAGAGMKVAIIQRQIVRWHLYQHRLHAHQDHDRKRLCGPHGLSRSRFRSSQHWPRARST